MAEQSLFSRRGLAVALVIFALTTSLAGRVVHGNLFGKTTAHSTSVSEKVQHRDKDAAEWSPPVVELTLLWVSEPSVRPEFTHQVYLQLHCDSLYNRPPPVS